MSSFQVTGLFVCNKTYVIQEEAIKSNSSKKQPEYQEFTRIRTSFNME